MSGKPPLRPGILLGVYPEAEAPRNGRLEQAFDRSMGALRRFTRPSASRYRGVLRRIRAQDEALQAMSDTELAQAVREARRRLRAEALQDAPCIRAFALVRELSERVLGMRPYDVQLIGGWVMLRGMVAEMQTGEGKTLTACLPAATAALSGMPVHIVTVNDYLVQRDAAAMGPLFRALGLSVGTIVEGMQHAERRAAYACDIVYCTNKQLVFDYLRDRIVRGGLGTMRMRLDGLFGERAVTERLLLRGLCFAIVDEADSVLIDEARTPLIISRAGEGDDREALYRQALQLAMDLNPGVDYRIDLARREAELTEAGKQGLAARAAPMSGVWAGTKRREELVRQALFALELLVRDQHYLVKDDKIQIIDEYTGRLMPDRSWEQGLHQLVEAKEGCAITAPAETIARISFQRFFRRYLLLAGMTGTAREVVSELWFVYRLNLVTVPTNRPLRRRALPGRVFRGEDAKWAAVVEHIAGFRSRRRPVLVGTTSVRASEHLSGLLTAAGIEHRVLNARQDQDEAKTVADAGQPATVTVATNMAGRGTDIKLGPGVAESGGLHVIATERHEAGRIDRQLYGRCGRQGDPGSFDYLVSLDDDLITHSRWRWLARLVPSGVTRAGALGRLVFFLAQHGAERRNAKVRRQLLKIDEQTGDLLAFSGRME